MKSIHVIQNDNVVVLHIADMDIKEYSKSGGNFNEELSIHVSPVSNYELYKRKRVSRQDWQKNIIVMMNKKPIIINHHWQSHGGLTVRHILDGIQVSGSDNVEPMTIQYWLTRKVLSGNQLSLRPIDDNIRIFIEENVRPPLKPMI